MGNRYDPSYERAFLFLTTVKRHNKLLWSKRKKEEKRFLKRTRIFAAILGVAFLISVLILIYAVAQQQKAKQSAAIAVEQRNIAEKEKTLPIICAEWRMLQDKKLRQRKEEAVREKDNAVKQKERAEILKQEADIAKDKALKAKNEADILRAKEEEAKNRAEELKQEADAQKLEAIAQKELAIQRKLEADKAKEKAERLRLLEIGHSLAIQTQRMEKAVYPELTSLMALTAYNFNTKYNGELNDADIFNALYYAAIDKEQTSYDEHQDAIRALTYSPDGRQFASGGDDGKIVLWNAKNPLEHIQKFDVPSEGHNNVRALKFLSDKLIASTAEGSLLAWSINNPEKEPLVISKLNSPIKSISVNQSNQTLAACNEKGQILIWRNGDLLAPADTITQIDERLNAIEFVPNKNELAITTEKNGLLFINMEGERLKKIDPLDKQFYSIDFSDNGRWMAVGTMDGNILLWDREKDDGNYRELNAHDSGISAFAFKPDNKILASSGRDGEIKLWVLDELDNQPRTLIGHKKWIWDIDYSPDGNTLISGGSDNDVKTWLVNSEQLAEKLEEELCRKLGRNFTQEEWDKYVGEDVEYQKTCIDKN